jgi:LAGLIDADG DNA endonuclease family
MPKFICESCEKEFSLWPSNIVQGGTGQHCSRKCRSQHWEKTLPSLTDFQHQLIIGSLLGDGGLHKRKKETHNSYFYKKAAHANLEYLNWHKEKLGDYFAYLNKEFAHLKTTSKTYEGFNLSTRCHPVFTSLRKKWYSNNKKVIPKDLVISPFILAIWFCDDGYNDFKDGTACFCTDCFTLDEHKLLVDVIKRDVDIDVRIVKYRETWRLDVPTTSYLPLLNLIKPFVMWDCFQHKIKIIERSLTRKPYKIIRNRVLISPIGESYTVKNFTNFIKEHNLNRGAIYKVINGKFKQHHGWTLPNSNS